MLNDLTPAEQRKRIEEIPQKANQYNVFGSTKTAFFGTVADLEDLCNLALAAVPKIEWVEQPGRDFTACTGEFRLSAFRGRSGAIYWMVAVGVVVVRTGTAPTLEAAQAAAEAALLKLVRGE